MKTWQQLVEDFHALGGGRSHTSARDCGCHHCRAPAVRDTVARVHIMRNNVRELYQAQMNGDVVDVAAALAQTMYAVLGTAVVCGVDLDPVFRIVHDLLMADSDVDEQRARVAEIIERQTNERKVRSEESEG